MIQVAENESDFFEMEIRHDYKSIFFDIKAVGPVFL